MIEFETEVIEVIRRTPEVKSFRFKTDRDVDFKAGQFFFVTIRIGGEERTKHFSFSSSPTEKGYVEFTKKITGSDFSRALNNIKKGDWARLRMPAGSFTFEGEYPKIAFLTGGIGITPIRSMCKFVADSGISTDIVVLYGNNKEEDIVFREDLDAMAASGGNIRVVYTLTAPDIDDAGWKGRKGFIDEDMIKEEIPDHKERVFYTCGPPGMVANLSNILSDRLAVPADRLRTENFPGY